MGTMKMIPIEVYRGQELRKYIEKDHVYYIDNLTRVEKEMVQSAVPGAIIALIGPDYTAQRSALLQVVAHLDAVDDAYCLMNMQGTKPMSPAQMERVLSTVTERYILIPCATKMYDFVLNAKIFLKYAAKGHTILLSGAEPLMLAYAMRGCLKGHASAFYALPLLYEDSTCVPLRYMGVTKDARMDVAFTSRWSRYMTTTYVSNGLMSALQWSELTPELVQLRKYKRFNSAVLEVVHKCTMSLLNPGEDVRLTERQANVARALEDIGVLGRVWTADRKRWTYYAKASWALSVVEPGREGTETEDVVNELCYARVKSAVYKNVVAKAERKGCRVLQYLDDRHRIELVVVRGDGMIDCISLVDNKTSEDVARAKAMMQISNDALMRYCGCRTCKGITRTLIITNGKDTNIEHNVITAETWLLRLNEHDKDA